MSFLEEAARWRRRAKRVRALAKHVPDVASRQLKLETAAHYDELADLADERREAIAQRTAKARALAEAVRKGNADRHAANVLPIIREAQKNGAQSLRDIAKALTARGVATRKGGKWHANSVRGVLRREPTSDGGSPSPSTAWAIAMHVLARASGSRHF
jgi:hypothetical protein